MNNSHAQCPSELSVVLEGPFGGLANQPKACVRMVHKMRKINRSGALISQKKCTRPSDGKMANQVDGQYERL